MPSLLMSCATSSPVLMIQKNDTFCDYKYSPLPKGAIKKSELMMLSEDYLRYTCDNEKEYQQCQ